VTYKEHRTGDLTANKTSCGSGQRHQRPQSQGRERSCGGRVISGLRGGGLHYRERESPACERANKKKTQEPKNHQEEHKKNKTPKPTTKKKKNTKNEKNKKIKKKKKKKRTKQPTQNKQKKKKEHLPNKTPKKKKNKKKKNHTQIQRKTEEKREKKTKRKKPNTKEKKNKTTKKKTPQKNSTHCCPDSSAGSGETRWKVVQPTPDTGRRSIEEGRRRRSGETKKRGTKRCKEKSKKGQAKQKSRY